MTNKSKRKQFSHISKRISTDHAFLLSRKPRTGRSAKKVLGRAVYSVRSNPNLVWMLLSENVDAFVRSEEEEEETNSIEPEAVAAAAVAMLTEAGSKRKR
jgi:hypothetical protein